MIEVIAIRNVCQAAGALNPLNSIINKSVETLDIGNSNFAATSSMLAELFFLKQFYYAFFKI